MAAGLSTAQLASEFGLSKGTVRHWLRRYNLRTCNRGGRRPSLVAESGKNAGLMAVTMTCAHHGDTEFFLEGRGYYRCKRCRSERVANRRRKVKAILAGEAGGSCQLCGYDRYLGALEFHHVDPSQKRMGLSYKGAALALETLRAEAKKCMLLCANCHAEVEGGIASVPVECRTSPGAHPQ